MESVGPIAPSDTLTTLMMILTTLAHSTIHGMVYNAMKLFMEVQPQLFDECSNNYAEKQHNAPSEAEQRHTKWQRIAQAASDRRASSGGGPPQTNGSLERLLPVTTGHGQKIMMPATNPSLSQHTNGATGEGFGQDRLGRLKDLSISDAAVPGRWDGVSR